MLSSFGTSLELRRCSFKIDSWPAWPPKRLIICGPGYSRSHWSVGLFCRNTTVGSSTSTSSSGGLASVFARTKRDGPVEVSIVGRFGFVGVAAVLGIMRSPIRCWMEVPGEALRITSKDLRRVMDAIPAVRQHLLNYVHALLIQNSLLALCNVRHELEERLCRWLLLASDRLDEKAIPLTHDQLSISLGVRRASVTTTLANLEEAGAVIKSRRAIEIASRAILEKKTCECYRIIASEYARISGSGRHII